MQWTIIGADGRVSFGVHSTLGFDPSGIFGLALSPNRGDTLFGFRSTNMGQSWSYCQAPYISYHSQLKVLSPTVAFAWDGKKIIRTSDAGNSWTTATAPIAQAQTLFEFLPVSEPLAFLWYHERVSLWRTEDGGSSWNNLGVAGHVQDIATADGRTLLLSLDDSPGTILRSIDGGFSWDSTLIDTTWLFDKLYLVTPAEGIAIARRTWSDSTDIGNSRLRRAIFRTEDGGTNWNKVYDFTIPWRYGEWYGGGNTYVEVSFSRSPRWLLKVHYWFTGSGGDNVQYYGSDDNAITWWYGGNYQTVSSQWYYTPAFAPPDWMIGIVGTQITQDGGRTWQERNWFVAAAAFLSPYEVIGVRDSVILRGTMTAP